MANEKARQADIGDGEEAGSVASWLDFWDAEHSIYVNRRHVEAHYRRLFADIAPLLPPGPFTLMDYGCGDALMAPALVKRGGRVLLFEQAPARRAGLARRFAGMDGVAVLDEAGWRALPAESCDLVLLISVIQYLDRAALAALLAALRPLLSPGGRLVIGDIVGPEAGMIKDVVALLTFAAGNGFLLAALAGLARTWLSDYRKIRQRLGFTSYTPDGLAALLAEGGWRSERLAWNIGHAGHRRSMVAWPMPGKGL
ncbi:class I SAM-dependent methyltransferase [Shumkonia mesophila]|uniref:class I SAM-dependent methyltransferase n=1 Tax=Shumkonia mesophila TaxID=2838854 RepID=UPI0029351BAB|nr:methyltransferase domain-containing protein [Shumkonia mesophila]